MPSALATHDALLREPRQRLLRPAAQPRCPPAMCERHARQVALAQLATDEGAFVGAWAEGRALTVEQAIALAQEKSS